MADPSGAHAIWSISCPSSSLNAVTLRPFHAGASATWIFLRPCSKRSQATRAPVGAAVNSEANGAFMTCSSVNEACAGRTQITSGASAQRRRAADFISAVSTLFHDQSEWLLFAREFNLWLQAATATAIK